MAAKKKATKKTTAKAEETKSVQKVEESSTSASENVASPPQPTPDQQAQIDAVLKKTEQEARDAVASILGGNSVAGLGTPSGDVERRQDHVQADTLPGTRRKDKTYVPEKVYDERNGRVKRVLNYADYRYCMIPEEDFHTYTMNGWKFCHYDGGSRSGLLNEGWQGTGDSVFMRDLRGYCRRGDVYLMWTDIANYAEIKAADREAAEKAGKAPVGEFANVAYGKGIRAQAQIDGEDFL